MLAETILDFAGLDYLALHRRLRLDPALPGAWPHTGLSQLLPCGDVAFRLERPIGGAVHKLDLRARLDHPVALEVAVTCPGLTELGPWRCSPETPPPAFNPRTGRLTWNVELPAGESVWMWVWG
jgi:hypothetical protein